MRAPDDGMDVGRGAAERPPRRRENPGHAVSEAITGVTAARRHGSPVSAPPVLPHGRCAQAADSVPQCLERGASLMAAAWLRQIGGEQFDVDSAGTHPAGGPHPVAVVVMGEVGIDLASVRLDLLAPTASCTASTKCWCLGSPGDSVPGRGHDGAAVGPRARSRSSAARLMRPIHPTRCMAHVAHCSRPARATLLD